MTEPQIVHGVLFMKQMNHVLLVKQIRLIVSVRVESVWESQVTSNCLPMTGIGRFENTIFFLTMPTTLQLDEVESSISVGWPSGPVVVRESSTIASSPSSGPAFPKPSVRRITASGFGNDAIVPSRRWCPMSRLGLLCYDERIK